MSSHTMATRGVIMNLKTSCLFLRSSLTVTTKLPPILSLIAMPQLYTSMNKRFCYFRSSLSESLILLKHKKKRLSLFHPMIWFVLKSQLLPFKKFLIKTRVKLKLSKGFPLTLPKSFSLTALTNRIQWLTRSRRLLL